MASYPKVDVHHHVVPPQFIASGEKHRISPALLPSWTPSADKAFSESIGVKTSIVSVSTPGVTAVPDPEESAQLARSLNEYCASLRDQDPLGYGFLATVPSLEHTDLAIREIRYALDALKADGVTLFTRYGSGDEYLGHEEYVPVWKELNARRAVVFVHPLNNKNGELFNEKLVMPAFDWPHETGRTAMDMVMNKRLLQFPDVKVILSHGGGTLPALARRAVLVTQPYYGAVISEEDLIGQAKSFYFDLALSGTPDMLPLVLGFAKKGHILFGSDFPHAVDTFSARHAKFIDEYAMKDSVREEIYHGTAQKLFPRLRGPS